jgi:RNA polymerase sigma-70 factor (ECF subfamily)
MDVSYSQRKALAAEGQMRAVRDLHIAEAYRAGRPDVFDELATNYEGTVHRLLAGLNVPSGDVEDLRPEVSLRIFRNLHRFRGQSSFDIDTWLCRITINVFFDRSKKRKRSDSRLSRLQSALIDASDQRPYSDDPFRATYNALTHQTFWAAIAALPELFRDVVAMREVDDLSYEEIALATGISIGTVRLRLSRARVRLKELLRSSLADAPAA